MLVVINRDGDDGWISRGTPFHPWVVGGPPDPMIEPIRRGQKRHGFQHPQRWSIRRHQPSLVWVFEWNGFESQVWLSSFHPFRLHAGADGEGRLQGGIGLGGEEAVAQGVELGRWLGDLLLAQGAHAAVTLEQFHQSVAHLLLFLLRDGLAIHGDAQAGFEEVVRLGSDEGAQTGEDGLGVFDLGITRREQDHPGSAGGGHEQGILWIELAAVEGEVIGEEAGGDFGAVNVDGSFELLDLLPALADALDG